jgi:EAL domain-containing protein (putative c-di-GMP-specific phosphodiesterase class I)
VLLRMSNGLGEVLSPRDFLLTADRFQLMPDIDRWVTKATIDALRLNYPALNEMETVYINISGQSINDDRFLEFIVDLLDDDFDNHRICFDISEASLISSIERARFFIATLKELGCRIALDDFGLGTSSFELLKRLEVNYLKINANFIRNMAYSSVDYEIVLALSRIAKTLHVKTIAQGVTTLATKDSLLGMGVDYVQGLLVDQPRPVLIENNTTHQTLTLVPDLSD